jgi:hypothetical protein
MKLGRHVNKGGRAPHAEHVRPPVQWCRWCQRNAWAQDVTGCIEFTVNGLERLPVSWPPDMRIPDSNPCGCGAHVGQWHHADCSLEMCPWADEHPDDGEQLTYCGCLDEPEDTT